MTKELAKSHGLTEEEYSRILSILGREPNIVELGIFSVMWSEHCSYKSTRVHLKNLPTKAPWVICGPGENAGIIDIEDNQAIVFKMESHNHPSFIEPFQGAATGVGGIMRDVFTMGARPIANLNSLRFGELSHPKTNYLLNGVVGGIGFYGNCVGVPTVSGETTFHKSYNGNILVNAMTIGLAKQDKIFYSAASNVGASVIYVGSKTGRDGIHGATMASSEFDDKAEEQRPTVQVGDPFAEKLLLEACLELMQSDAIIAIQDMGAAGLTSSSVEMTAKGGVGMLLNLDNVPTREEKMTSYEIMLSESQERMLMIIKPEKEEEARDIFAKYEVDFARVGEITNTGRLVIMQHGKVVADLPTKPLSDEAPCYTRPFVKQKEPKEVLFSELRQDKGIIDSLKVLVSCPDLVSKKWIYEQYDSKVMGNTIFASGQKAALVRIGNSKKAVALSTDCTPRYVAADPYMGAIQAVAENYRNISSVGATPLAITNCLNFGNPEKPEIMGQIVSSIEGIRDACIALDYPVVSGNVSLYNETNGNSIQPTPNIGGVGLLKDLNKRCSGCFKNDGDLLFVIGKTVGHIGQSLYLREVEDREEGLPPHVDLQTEKTNAEFIRKGIAEDLFTACSDISDGGLLITIAEMAMSSNMGAKIDITKGIDIPPFAYLFGEDQARYVVTIAKNKMTEFIKFALGYGIPYFLLGNVGGSKIDLASIGSIEVSELKVINELFM